MLNLPARRLGDGALLNEQDLSGTKSLSTVDGGADGFQQLRGPIRWHLSFSHFNHDNQALSAEALVIDPLCQSVRGNQDILQPEPLLEFPNRSRTNRLSSGE